MNKKLIVRNDKNTSFLYIGKFKTITEYSYLK